jgi:hypothetical protein
MKMCPGTTRHILVGQKGSQGKKKKKAAVLLYCRLAITTTCTYLAELAIIYNMV